MAETKNLGFVKAIYRGTTAPSNTEMLWYNTGSNLHYYYDVNLSEWRVLGQTGYVLLRQSPDIASVNNLDFNGYQSFAFTDNVNNLQLGNATGLNGGELISIRFFAGQTCEHNVTKSGVYEPWYLANKADSTFTSDFRILFEYKKNEQRFEEIGRVSEAVAQAFLAQFAEANCYTSTVGLTIKGLSVNLLNQVATLEHYGSGSKTISGNEILIGAGTCFGIIGRDSSNNKLFEIPCCEGNADKAEIVELKNGWVLTIEGTKTVTTQNSYFPPMFNGFDMIENADTTSEYLFICYDNDKNKIY